MLKPNGYPTRSFLRRTANVVLSLLVLMLKTMQQDTPQTTVLASEMERLPFDFKFLSKLGEKFQEVYNFDTFSKEARIERALSLVAFYSNKYCAKC